MLQFFSFLLILFLPISLAADPIEFRISSVEVAINEPLIIEAISKTGSIPKPVRKQFELGSVIAIYSGIQTETKIINFKATSSTILKFTILQSQPGIYTIPPIQVEENGQIYQIPEQKFTVTKKQYQPPSNLLNRFFSGNESQLADDAISETSYVKFHTSKSQIYLGEPVIGYFVFYNKKIRKPFFERNPNESISFPYFTSTLLSGVKINYPEQVDINLNGQIERYFTNPYNREIFALTPIKVGKFNIGKTKFDFTNSQRIHFYTHTIESSPKAIEVLPLPSPAPKSFSGEVGEYEMLIHFPKEAILEGNPWKFNIEIQGLGFCNQFKDPLLLSLPKNFPGKLQSLSVNKNQKFTEIAEQEYGFRCTANFEYSLFLKSNSSSFPFEISFFNPKNGNFQIIKKEFPALTLKRNPNLSKESKQEIIDYSKEKSISNLHYSIFIFSFLTTLCFGYFFWKKFKTGRFQKQNEYLLRIQNIAGQKTGILLEKILLDRGFSQEEAKFWVALRKKYVGEKFTNIFSILEPREKELLSKYIEGDLK